MIFSITPTLPASINVVYAVVDVGGCPRKYWDFGPSGFYNPQPYVDYNNTIIIPIDPITALRLKLATAEELGLPPAFATTLSLLEKP